ncbi:glycosyltransferase [Arcticibacter sp. MXS-1]|uniref:glycosyltransferase n=1 Tax=Arcticibacter sp. MXS-1 TaxID=3341726 RepID=UPI0035A91260
MKVAHLNAYDGNGGAGRACLRLNDALNAAGLQSEVLVNYKFGADPSIKSLNAGLLPKGFTAFGILLERFVSSMYSKKVKIPFSVPVWGKDLSAEALLKDADLIHLHWVNHAFLRPRDLKALQKLNKPIAWTFHDSNAFTGGCHVRYTCDHFENECGNCPVLKERGPRDLSHRIWKAKRSAYQKLDFHVVAPSTWMAASVKRSKLLRTAEIEVIPNTLDTEVFKPVEKSLAKQQAGLNPDSFIMLSGFMPSKKDLHKGTPFLLEALEILAGSTDVDRSRIELIVFGNRDEKNVPDFPVKTTFLGTISDDRKLAAYYSAADAFLTPSLEDNLPNTVMESLACGTPVVAFTTGGIPDMVQHKENGYLAQYRSSQDFAAGIEWVYAHSAPMALNAEARRTVEDKFSGPIIAHRHIELYQQMLENYRSKRAR